MPFGVRAHHEDRAVTMAVRNAGNEEVTSNSTWLKGEGVHHQSCVGCMCPVPGSVQVSDGRAAGWWWWCLVLKSS